MNWELIKSKLCRLVATAAILLGGAMLSAAASGSMPLWAAILGLFAAVIMLNAVCGILAGPPGGIGRPACPPRRANTLRYNCASCAAAMRRKTLPTPIRCDTHITAASPAQLSGCAGLAVSKISCYNEENAKGDVTTHEVVGSLC